MTEYPPGSTFDFDVTVSKERLMQVAYTILHEIRVFVNEGPTESELKHVKKRYIYDLDFDLDDPYKQIQRFGFAELFSQQVTFEEEKSIVQKITCEEIHKIACRIFVRNNLNIILVGPFDDTLKQGLEKLGHEF